MKPNDTIWVVTTPTLSRGEEIEDAVSEMTLRTYALAVKGGMDENDAAVHEMREDALDDLAGRIEAQIQRGQSLLAQIKDAGGRG